MDLGPKRAVLTNDSFDHLKQKGWINSNITWTKFVEEARSNSGSETQQPTQAPVNFVTTALVWLGTFILLGAIGILTLFLFYSNWIVAFFILLVTGLIAYLVTRKLEANDALGLSAGMWTVVCLNIFLCTHFIILNSFVQPGLSYAALFLSALPYLAIVIIVQIKKDIPSMSISLVVAFSICISYIFSIFPPNDKSFALDLTLIICGFFTIFILTYIRILYPNLSPNHRDWLINVTSFGIFCSLTSILNIITKVNILNWFIYIILMIILISITFINSSSLPLIFGLIGISIIVFQAAQEISLLIMGTKDGIMFGVIQFIIVGFCGIILVIFGYEYHKSKNDIKYHVDSIIATRLTVAVPLQGK
eukprot:c18260_g1_i1.p1 GENE.c18260_g1_i1~~c18260_g1_i1.p1  ORF type:complete len:363 (+),score=90.37 c18260_g1_i1:48-1136(+)